MHSKTLALLCLSASVLATAELEKKQYGDSYGSGSDDYYNSLMSDLNSLATDTEYLNYLTDLPTDYLSDYSDLPTDYLTDYSQYLTDLPSATNTLHAGGPDETTGTGGFDMPSMTSSPDIPNFSGDVPPASIESVLITAVPASYLSQLAIPSARSSIFSEIANGHYPQWYEDLPSSVKSWVSEHYEPTGLGEHAGGPNSAPSSGVVASGLLAAAGVFALAVLL
ncbi:hypothetical protein N7532_011589 [Penicillium argentinense]|uniref:Uncharacterized protein n=1 Tax=Penicillium argentinense TaxID=1131581 RepID=A0A9W9JV57_9EURO|nr:uncharacterized protein N7532_011589 [Penicillium argentinense]KAJ5082546.1 hypothetical protein N7532_011589 [Penicillium argentinense]